LTVLNIQLVEGKAAMAGLYFEDIQVGYKYSTPARTVFESDVGMFVAVAGLQEDLFCNLEYINNQSMFKKRFAPGALTWAIAQGLTIRTGLYEETFLAILGVNNMRLVAPVFINDTIHVEAEVLETRETSKGDKGVLNTLFRVKNQRDELVMEYEMKQLVAKKNAG
jgi:acyl dehydratase